jgi:hypothetical protein
MERRCFNSPWNLLLALLVMLLTSTPSLAQKCFEGITATAPDSRYQDHGDGTVTDLQTGLQWQQCSLGLSGSGCATGEITSFVWGQALQQADKLNSNGGFAGHSDWRLPNLKELKSLIEEGCYAPAINFRLFPNSWTRSGYWSSLQSDFNPNTAWVVYFDNGTTNDVYHSIVGVIRLVRGEQ